MSRSVLEKTIQAEIEAALGAEPDVLLLRNAVGDAIYYNEDGTKRTTKYGLGKGSPDLVSILRLSRRTPVMTSGGRLAGHTATDLPELGVWFCLEVKVPGEDADPHQAKCHEQWRRFGAIVEVVHSVAEARDALARARRLLA